MVCGVNGMKKKLSRIIGILIGVFIVVILGYVMLIVCDTSNPNYDLEWNEMKSYFKETVYLNYIPDYEQIREVQVYSLTEMKSYDEYENGNAIYNTNTHIQKITDYLNDIKLVEASYDELSNKSADGSIRYCDNDSVVKLFALYGGTYIEDVYNDKLYRTKGSFDIIESLSSLEL